MTSLTCSPKFKPESPNPASAVPADNGDGNGNRNDVNGVRSCRRTPRLLQKRHRRQTQATGTGVPSSS